MTYKFYTELPEEAKHIRETVFVKEQGFQNEFDDTDSFAKHLVIFEEDKPVATGRLYLKDTTAYFGRIAVLPEHRGQGYGEKIMALLDTEAKALGMAQMRISAQCRAGGFYEKQGYRSIGETYDDEYCPHIDMIKDCK